MKNKCSNKIALGSNNNLLLTASACWFAVTRCPCAKNTFLTKNDDSNQEMDSKDRTNKEKKIARNTDGILNFVSILAIYFYLVGILLRCHSLFSLAANAGVCWIRCCCRRPFIHTHICMRSSIFFFSPSPHPPVRFSCCSFDSCCHFPFRVMIHTAYQNEMSRKNDRIKIFTAYHVSGE